MRRATRERRRRPTSRSPPTTAHPYEEVFGVEVELDEDSLPIAPEKEGWSGGEGRGLRPRGNCPRRLRRRILPLRRGPSACPADLDESVDQVEPVHTDDESETDDEFQEHLRRMREEFRARAEDAALRVKQREAELTKPRPARSRAIGGGMRDSVAMETGDQPVASSENPRDGSFRRVRCSDPLLGDGDGRCG